MESEEVTVRQQDYDVKVADEGATPGEEPKAEDYKLTLEQFNKEITKLSKETESSERQRRYVSAEMDEYNIKLKRFKDEKRAIENQIADQDRKIREAEGEKKKARYNAFAGIIKQLRGNDQEIERAKNRYSQYSEFTKCFTCSVRLDRTIDIFVVCPNRHTACSCCEQGLNRCRICGAARQNGGSYSYKQIADGCESFKNFFLALAEYDEMQEIMQQENILKQNRANFVFLTDKFLKININIFKGELTVSQPEEEEVPVEEAEKKEVKKVEEADKKEEAEKKEESEKKEEGEKVEESEKVEEGEKVEEAEKKEEAAVEEAEKAKENEEEDLMKPNKIEEPDSDQLFDFKRIAAETFSKGKFGDYFYVIDKNLDGISHTLRIFESEGEEIKSMELSLFCRAFAIENYLIISFDSGEIQIIESSDMLPDFREKQKLGFTVQTVKKGKEDSIYCLGRSQNIALVKETETKTVNIPEIRGIKCCEVTKDNLLIATSKKELFIVKRGSLQVKDKIMLKSVPKRIETAGEKILLISLKKISVYSRSFGLTEEIPIGPSIYRFLAIDNNYIVFQCTAEPKTLVCWDILNLRTKETVKLNSNIVISAKEY